MKNKLKCVLLIDDDEATNYLHELIITESGITDKVVTVEDGVEALEYLISVQEDGSYPCPDLMFVDINMPRMNGWRFLEKYADLNIAQKGQTIVVVMLTTSLNPEDEDKAEKMGLIKDYKSKPMTLEMIEELMKTHFSRLM